MNFILILFLAPILACGQQTFTGSVVNNKTKRPVAFATVGLMKENIGINADEYGVFKLQSINKKLEHTLFFPVLGLEH